MYGRTLSIPDDLIETYWNLLVPRQADGAPIAERIAADPRETKRELAREVVAQYYSADDAAKAQEHFDRVIVNKQAPSDLPTVEFEEASMPLVELLMALKAFPSKNEARRMIQQGAVQADEQKITDINAVVELGENPVTIKAGKRKFFKVKGV